MAVEQLKLFRPLVLIILSAVFVPITAFHLITTFQLRRLASWQDFRHAWFGRCWSYYGPVSTENAAPLVEPLLRHARGHVLDLGPGSGQWLYLFAASKNTNIVKIYGVEPNPEHHAALRLAVTKAGLDGIYEILPVGAQDLHTCGIDKASIDTITTIQVLCSVPDPQSIIKDLYAYLKPGGYWLVYEHVRTPHFSEFVASWQGKRGLCIAVRITEHSPQD